MKLKQNPFGRFRKRVEIKACEAESTANAEAAYLICEHPQRRGMKRNADIDRFRNRFYQFTGNRTICLALF